jgi:hypothetical protein
MDALRLDQAIKLFERSKRESGTDPHYLDRLKANLVLSRWQEALSLAQKAIHVEGIFVSAIAAGEFAAAGRALDRVCGDFCDRREHPAANQYLVSSWELAHLILYVALATKTSEATEAFVERVVGSSRYVLTALTDFVSLFVQRRFTEFDARLREWRNEFELSYYVTDVKVQLEAQIRLNVIANAVRAYANVPISDIQRLVGRTEPDIIAGLRLLITEGIVKGYLDIDQRMFYGTDDRTEEREMVDAFERTVIVREKLEKLKWKKKYAEVAAPP